MGENYTSICELTAYIRTLENEIRDIRQRLQEVERSIIMSKYHVTLPAKLSEYVSKIEPIANEFVKTIYSAEKEKVDHLGLLAIPEMPQRIIAIKSILGQIGI